MAGRQQIKHGEEERRLVCISSILNPVPVNDRKPKTGHHTSQFSSGSFLSPNTQKRELQPEQLGSNGLGQKVSELMAAINLWAVERQSVWQAGGAECFLVLGTPCPSLAFMASCIQMMLEREECM